MTEKKETREYPPMQTVHADMTAYMLADGKDVKIYHDVNMGGTVVEYDNGE